MNNEPDYDNLYFEEKKMHTPQVGDVFARIDETKVSKRRINECMAANIKLVEQNAQLKELLKEYKDITAIALLYTKDDKEFEKAKNIRERIDEALR